MNSCENCAKRKEIKNECPWDGTYHHKDDEGNKIGICNAYEKEINYFQSCRTKTDS